MFIFFTINFNILHKDIKFQICLKEPIIRIRYKFSEYKDYNICVFIVKKIIKKQRNITII